MKLAFPLKFEAAPEGGYTVQGLPPFENVVTEGGSRQEAHTMAVDALTGVLSVMLDDNMAIPRPSEELDEGVEMVQPDLSVALAVLLRWAREEEGLTQVDVAERLGVKQQSYQRLEKPNANPSIQTVAKAFKAIGRELQLAI